MNQFVQRQVQHHDAQNPCICKTQTDARLVLQGGRVIRYDDVLIHDA